jgi:hypothetical protein
MCCTMKYHRVDHWTQLDYELHGMKDDRVYCMNLEILGSARSTVKERFRKGTVEGSQKRPHE